MNLFKNKLQKQLKKLFIHTTPISFKILWPKNRQLMISANMQDIDFKQKFFIKLLIYKNFEERFAEPGDIIVDQNLFIIFENQISRYIFLLKDVLIIFHKEIAEIRMCSHIQQFVFLKNQASQFLFETHKKYKKIKSTLNKIERNEILGLLPEEMLQKHDLKSEMKIHEFILYSSMLPYTKHK